MREQELGGAWHSCLHLPVVCVKSAPAPYSEREAYRLASAPTADLQNDNHYLLFYAYT
jgi:hypothetical protein